MKVNKCSKKKQIKNLYKIIARYSTLVEAWKHEANAEFARGFALGLLGAGIIILPVLCLTGVI